ncbi:hypothetical protein M758_12G123100 [Ceratodon purpureus]|nr:hypothetical protein M758_12G123100 [Ceratodon purpureus]
MASMITPTKAECKRAEIFKKDVRSKMESIKGMLDSFEQELVSLKVTHKVRKDHEDHSPQATKNSSQLMAGHKIQNMINCLIMQITVLSRTNMIKRTDEINVGLEGSQVLERAKRRMVISKHEVEEFQKKLKNLQDRYIDLLLQLYHQNHQANQMPVD